MNDFDRKVSEYLAEGLVCEGIRILQLNLGRTCNLACSHCHLECSPQRREIMGRDVMDRILAVTENHRFELVDITGGSPEMNPGLRPFVEALRSQGRPVQVRTNLTSFLQPGGDDLLSFFRDRQISLVASLPCYLEENVDAQRGAGVYKRSIEAIRRLNEAGYGREGALVLNLAFNPGGPALPPDQSILEGAFRDELGRRFGISFSRLVVLANMPIGRFRRRLEKEGGLEEYRTLLREAFNPATLAGLMCRHQACIDWDGTVYDCDFNLALGMAVNHGAPRRIEGFDLDRLSRRQVVTAEHCFGCTAGAGSSCAGALTCAA
ncbi:MAG: radical SAM protein [Deltaproteobacteria bacterium HGW-Deltaproteobacteria-19]|jgi:radical SAM/Cys-rich protein|nr:MAG: radical SAM protein [Deltaproteobacteria bacterium HGW-Deltaproteobacteria-19]